MADRDLDMDGKSSTAIGIIDADSNHSGMDIYAAKTYRGEKMSRGGSSADLTV